MALFDFNECLMLVNTDACYSWFVSFDDRSYFPTEPHSHGGDEGHGHAHASEESHDHGHSHGISP